MDRKPDAADQTSQPIDGLKAWIDPVLVKFKAGEAEGGTLYGADGTIHIS
jgi:hypothetical protein